MDIPTRGWFCVIVPERLFYQGYFLPDTSEFDRLAKRWIDAGTEVWKEKIHANVSKDDIIGATAALIAKLAANHQHEKIAVPAVALSMLSDKKFFVVTARFERDGIATTLEDLNASSVDEARDMLDHLPAVQAIQAQIIQAVGLANNPETRH